MPAQTPPSTETVLRHTSAIVFYCYVHMSTSVIILVVQVTLKHLMFSGNIQNDQTFPICLQLGEQLLRTPVFVGILLTMPYINEQWKQSVKTVNIYMLHYRAAWPGPCMHALRHISIYRRARKHKHIDTEATRARSCSLKWADGWLTEWTGPWNYFASRIPNSSLLAHWPRRQIEGVGRMNM